MDIDLVITLLLRADIVNETVTVMRQFSDRKNKPNILGYIVYGRRTTSCDKYI